MIQDVPVMRLPQWGDLPCGVRDAFTKIDRAWGRVAAVSNESIDQWIASSSQKGRPAWAAGLEHRLSGELVRRGLPVPPPSKSALERKAWVSVRSEIEACFAEPASFIAALSLTSVAVGAHVTQVREDDVFSSPDNLNRRVRYPSAEHMEEGLSRIASWARGEQYSQSFRAAVVMTGICNLHPFRDGNGRVSRVFFNALIAGVKSTYFPLFDLSAISCGGFLIALRLAQYRNEWDWMAQFLVNGQLGLLGDLEGRRVED